MAEEITKVAKKVIPGVRATDIAIIAGGIVLAGGGVYILNRLVNTTLPREARALGAAALAEGPLIVKNTIDEVRANTYTGSIVYDALGFESARVLMKDWLAPAIGTAGVYLIAQTVVISRYLFEAFYVHVITTLRNRGRGAGVNWRAGLIYTLTGQFIRDGVWWISERIADHLQGLQVEDLVVQMGQDPDIVPVIPRDFGGGILAQQERSEVSTDTYGNKFNAASKQIWRECAGSVKQIPKYLFYMFMWSVKQMGGVCYHTDDAIVGMFNDDKKTQVRLRIGDFTMFMDIRASGFDWVPIIDISDMIHMEAEAAELMPMNLLPSGNEQRSVAPKLTSEQIETEKPKNMPTQTVRWF